MPIAYGCVGGHRGSEMDLGYLDKNEFHNHVREMLRTADATHILTYNSFIDYQALARRFQLMTDERVRELIEMRRW